MPQPTHRWLTNLEHTACGHRGPRGLRRRLVVRGWPDVTCQRCLGSIHGKLAQWQRQQPESPGGPPCHPRRGGADPQRVPQRGWLHHCCVSPLHARTVEGALPEAADGASACDCGTSHQ